MSKVGGTSIDPADPLSRTEWQASWLQDPIFDGGEYRELIHPNRNEENNGEIQNVHTLFRREWVVPDRPIRQARLYITADDCYKLYINGDFIGVGPAPAYPASFPYNAWDVTEALVAGKASCIGVHAFYQGMHSLTFPSGDNLQGVLLQLEVEYEGAARGGAAGNPPLAPPRRGTNPPLAPPRRGTNPPLPPPRRGSESTPRTGEHSLFPSSEGLGVGSSECTILVSDESWRCQQIDAYESRQVIGYQTAFSEHIDLRRLPRGWALPGFDDSEWGRPLVGDVPEHYTLSPQVTPPVAVTKRVPERIVKKGEGHYFVDFGCELSGETGFLVSGESGHEVEIRHGEELDALDTVRYDMRCNCLYQEFCTLSGRPNETLEFFDYKGFRYVEVLNWPEELTVDRVWALERHYPFPEDASSFTSANPLLNDIWTLCRNGVRVGTLDSYLDCPTREKGGFMGDGFVTGISHLILTGDARIMRKFLHDVASTSCYCPGLLSTAPNYVNGELAEYSMLWPVLLEYYYRWTADLEFVREMMPVLEGMLRYYISYENDAGLLQDVFSHVTGRYSVLVDWPTNLRDGYDDPFLMGDRTVDADPAGVVNTMVQGFYRCTLDAAGRLADAADCAEIRELVEGRAERVGSALLSQLRNPETGLFVDRNGSGHSALHANVTPLMSGMIEPDERARAVDLIRSRRLSCGVYFSFFVLKALYDVGESQLAYDLMTGRDLHSWHSMLEAGASTCMEAWAPDLKWNTSWCHPWSSAPIHMVAHELMGLRPAQPGWKLVRFAPRAPAELPSASISLTTPQGRVQASFEKSEGTITFRLQLPAACTATCSFETVARSVVVDGTEVACDLQCDDRGVTHIEVAELSGGSEHTVTVKAPGAVGDSLEMGVYERNRS